VAFYGSTPAGAYELEREPEAVELVIWTLELVRGNRDEALRLIPRLGAFLGFGGGRAFSAPAPPPPLPCAGERGRVLTVIADLLGDLNSPAALVPLLHLHNVNAADCPELAKRAAALDISMLETESWLIPASFLAPEIPAAN